MSVRFCQLPSGSRVAYATMGQGPPLVMPPGWLCHLEDNWSHPAAASAREKLAAARTFVWYDRLGCGLSDRDGFEPSVENDFDQLLAVLDHAGLDRVDLIGYSFAAAPAALLASRFPERVRRLAFYSAFARGASLGSTESLEVLKQLVASNWALGSRTLATVLLPNGSSQDLRWFSRFQRLATTADMAVRLLDHMWAMDIREVLSAISAPTLVLHNGDDPAVPLDAGREVAALVPGAELRVLGGNEHDPFIRDSGAVVDSILAFVDGRPPAPERVAGCPSAELTRREREVLRLLASGHTNKKIASELAVTVATVERHVTHIYEKLGAHGRADAALWAVAMGLTSPPTVR